MNIKSKDLDYPYNLVAEVFGDTQEEIIEKADTITDFAGSVEYVLCTLSERERKVLRHLYFEGLTLKDTGKIYDVTTERVRQIEAKAIRKLRHPSRAKYFEYGVTGVLEAIRTEYYNKFIDLEGKLIELCELNKITADKVINDVRLKQKYAPQKIEELDFSVRSYNCLKRAGIDTITQLAKLSYDELLNIRNLGRHSVAEIIEKLEKYGYYIRKNGEENE